MAKESKKDNFGAFFEAFADEGEKVDFKFSHEVISGKVEVIPTGSYLLDDALSSGGLPKGRIIQYYGPAASGKSFLSMIAIKNAQKQDPTARQIFIDAEQTYNTEWAAKLGIRPEKVGVVNGELAVNGRRCFEMLLGEPKEEASSHKLKGKKKEGLLDKIRSGELNINLIVLDSLGAIIPPGDDVAAVGKITMGRMAKFLTQEFKKLSLEVSKANIPFVVINHKRDSLDMYGPDHTFAGGNAYTHFLSANVYFESIQRKDASILNDNEEKIGGKVRAKIEKSKFGPHPRTVEFTVLYSEGVINIHEEVAELALKYKVIDMPTPRTYEFEGVKIAGSKDSFYEAIKTTNGLMDKLLEKIEEARDKIREECLLEQESLKEAEELPEEET